MLSVILFVFIASPFPLFPAAITKSYILSKIRIVPYLQEKTISNKYEHKGKENGTLDLFLRINNVFTTCTEYDNATRITHL